MKNYVIYAVFSLFFGLEVFPQESLCSRSDFLPNAVDSNTFSFQIGFSLLSIDHREPGLKVAGPSVKVLNKPTFSKGELEMFYFVRNKYDKEINPHVFVRIDLFGQYYLSSRFGAGFSSRKFGSSVGVLYGVYHRLAPYSEANFITSRQRAFENYSMPGVYLHSSSSGADFLFIYTKEKTYQFYSVRAGVNIGNSFFLGEETSLLRRVKFVMSHETFIGFGTGLSFSPVRSGFVDILWTKQDRSDLVSQLKVGNRLKGGLQVSLTYFVN